MVKVIEFVEPRTNVGLVTSQGDEAMNSDALDGAPGIHSARFAAQDTGAEGNSSDAENNAKLLRLLWLYI